MRRLLPRLNRADRLILSTAAVIVLLTPVLLYLLNDQPEVARDRPAAGAPAEETPHRPPVNIELKQVQTDSWLVEEALSIGGVMHDCSILEWEVETSQREGEGAWEVIAHEVKQEVLICRRWSDGGVFGSSPLSEGGPR